MPGVRDRQMLRRHEASDRATRAAPHAGSRRRARARHEPAAIATRGLGKRYGDTLALDAPRPDGRARARCTATSGPTAPARRPRSGCCSGLHRPSGGTRRAVRHRRLARPGRRAPAGRLRRRRAVPVAGADRRRDARVPRPPARRHRRRLPRRARRALPARHRQEGAGAVEGQPPEGAAGRRARHPRRPAAARRADQRPRPADGDGLPRDACTEAKERGQTVFLSSHILSEVEALCDRVGILRAGRLVDEGTLARAAPPQRADGRGDVRGPGARARRRSPGVQRRSAPAPNALRFEVTRQRSAR